MGAPWPNPNVRVHPGREKGNFYGALNRNNGQEIVMRATVMNAATAVRHLERILQVVPEVPLLLLWDRAPWHFGQPMRDVLAAQPRLEVRYFPVAAPDLNPQEQVWQAARRAVSHNHTVPRLPELAERFECHLTSTTFESSFLDHYGFNAISPMFK